MVFYVIAALPLMMTGRGMIFLIFQGWKVVLEVERGGVMPGVVPSLAGLILVPMDCGH